MKLHMLATTLLLAMLCFPLGCTPASTSDTTSSEATPEPQQVPKLLRVLTIGNSFSLNGTQYLAPILNDYGVDAAVVGVLYRAGASLQDHEKWLNNELAGYDYYQAINSAEFQETKAVNIFYGLEKEDWDIVILQHGGGKQGSIDTYDRDIITHLIETVKEYCPNAAIYWHMCWSYAEGFTGHPIYVSEHNCSAESMTRGAAAAVEQVILPDERFAGIIPSGTLIHKMRETYSAVELQTDLRHLSNPLGQYSAATVFACVLLDRSIDELTYCPLSLQNTELLSQLKEWVPEALADPFRKNTAADEK